MHLKAEKYVQMLLKNALICCAYRYIENEYCRPRGDVAIFPGNKWFDNLNLSEHGQTYNCSFKQWTAGFKALVICVRQLYLLLIF